MSKRIINKPKKRSLSNSSKKKVIYKMNKKPRPKSPDKKIPTKKARFMLSRVVTNHSKKRTLNRT